MVRQFCEDYAKDIYESELWKEWDSKEIVKIQLFQDRLCVPFDVFHKAVEEVFGRPVWTHEFAFAEKLRREYLGEREPPIAGILATQL
jgi:hypothetical protein